MSDFNFDKNELQKMMNKASKKSGIDMQKLKQAADGGRLDDFLNQNLSQMQAKRLRLHFQIKKQRKKSLKARRLRSF